MWQVSNDSKNKTRATKTDREYSEKITQLQVQRIQDRLTGTEGLSPRDQTSGAGGHRPGQRDRDQGPQEEAGSKDGNHDQLVSVNYLINKDKSGKDLGG